MYALILPASTPFVLLAAVMALSWWEDRILPTPPVQAAEAPMEAPLAPGAPARPPEPVHVEPASTRDVAGR
ncbi:hypothetical protein IQ64_35250 [Streptomyces stelliscabiei]|uniref:Endonuclease/exonuclease/phosphatase (EEP) superfamily protein YafD n=1 Tax=Streptomyces stelliscabiei TaxID=146820 RepID=A0A8I0TUV2_9ACTN|nr:hypothetical protein IQ64_35250 [Streptomyces stelliscabiei]MBE1601177.1 endonuclease/exonuclease/phosphatase (EEP) superfamily protein YafD [Streptomyces stelliscabiei]